MSLQSNYKSLQINCKQSEKSKTSPQLLSEHYPLTPGLYWKPGLC